MNATTNNAINLQAIADEAVALGCRASVESFLGYVEIETLNGRIGHLGTANGPWGVDVFRNRQAFESTGAPEASREIPESHLGAPEALARYVVGLMAGIYEYMSYPTEAQAKRATRTRSGRS